MARASAMTMEFDPRSLVCAHTCLAASRAATHDGPRTSCLDAIFIPTRKRTLYLYDLLQELQTAEAPVFILVSEPTDVPPDLGHLNRRPTVLTAADPAFQRGTPVLHLPTPLTAMCAPPEWDLPTKRNYALWFARRQGFKKVLLVDDDIRGLSPRLLEVAARVLDDYSVAGPYVEDFPDLSFAGHANRIAGGTVHTFLSGSCLFVKTPAVHAFFPQIYNEDWLFLLPHILDKTAASVGQVRQVPYDPFSSSQARFQEFGEVIADGLYWLLCTGRFSERLEMNIWGNILAARRAQLVALSESVSAVEHSAALQAALEIAFAIRADQCVEFLVAWEHALDAWQTAVRDDLRERPTST